MFANRKYEELSYPNNPKICDPILVTLLKMRPHYSQSSRENATHPAARPHWCLIRKYPPPLPEQHAFYLYINPRQI